MAKDYTVKDDGDGRVVCEGDSDIVVARFPNVGDNAAFDIFAVGVNAAKGSLFDANRGHYVTGNLDQLLEGRPPA